MSYTEFRSPIKNQIKAVFVHVQDLTQSVQWYSKLLGVPAPFGEVEGPIYMFNTVNGIALLLDDNRDNPQGVARPSYMLDTGDIDAAYLFLKNQGAQITREIERYPDISFFNFIDPDGNVVMVSQDHPL